MDTTFETNRHGYKLVTLLVRDDSNTWIPAFQYITNRETKEAFAGGLSIARRKTNWYPRYMITDDFSAEKGAIKEVFRGINEGEMGVSIFDCLFHTMKTLRTKLGAAPEALGLMMQAVHKRTKVGCEMMIEAAIEKAGYAKDYLKRNWTPENSHEWALWSRQHSILLLQCTTTSPLEAYHSHLKSNTKSWCGFIGLGKALITTRKQIDERISNREHEAKTKVLSVCTRFNQLQQFPLTIQRMLAAEIFEADKQIDEGHALNPVAFGDCTCNFCSKWNLPCKNLFRTAIMQQTEIPWDELIEEFSELGFGVYYTREMASAAPVPITNGPNDKARREFKQIIKTIEDEFYTQEKLKNHEEVIEKLRKFVINKLN